MSAEAKEAARRDTVDSSLKFADTFPEHENAPAVLVAAAQDLFEMKDFALARELRSQAARAVPEGDRASCSAPPGS